MNNWYNRINGIPSVQPQPQQVTGMQFQNPLQKANYILNAIRNPVQFVKEQFPDVPDNLRNNPDAVLNYLQQTRGTRFAQDMQQVSGMNGRR